MENHIYEIKPSNIEGLGVFATQDIKKGTKICDYYGHNTVLKCRGQISKLNMENTKIIL
jgi:ribosomal protein S13